MVSPYDRGYRGPVISQKTSLQLGPQKTLMQKYDQLDNDTKKQFNEHFMSTLETAMRGHKNLTSLIQ